MTFSNLTALDTFDVTGNCLIDFEPVQAPINDVPNLIGATESCECITDDTRSCGSDTGECVAGTETCVAGLWSGDCVGEIEPAADDATCDGLDNDCDGTADEDYTATATSCGIGACEAAGTLTCSGGVEVDSCTPGTPGDEICDAPDTDEDGMPDEWEQYYFSDLDQIGSGDPDGDGFTNIQEVQCGSDPVDSSSRCTRPLPWLMLLLE